MLGSACHPRKMDRVHAWEVQGRILDLEASWGGQHWAPLSEMKKTSLSRKLAAGAIEAGPLRARDQKEHDTALKVMFSNIFSGYNHYTW